jgi:hypothetical protein
MLGLLQSLGTLKSDADTKHPRITHGLGTRSWDVRYYALIAGTNP